MELVLNYAGDIIEAAATMSSVTAIRSVPEPATGSVVSFDGTVIHYDVYDAPSQSMILIVPGFWRDRRHPSMVRLAHFLHGLGYRTAMMDPRGHGESEGSFGFNLHEHHDVAAVANELLKTSTISTITLVGFSYGGAIAISTTARHDLPIGSLLLISPVADFSMIVPKINPLTIHRHIAISNAMRRPRIAWSVRRHDKLRAVDDVVNLRMPKCFIHVKNDWLINHRHSVALYEAAKEPKELHVLDIEGNYHSDRIFNAASDAIEPLVREFLARHTAR
jgi:pimeloyl-ACP methyl ester carboxylesterase